MRIGIVGSRDFDTDSLIYVKYFVEDLPRDTIILSGGARGVDRYTVKVARACRLKTVEYLPDKKAYGIPKAFFVRNLEIVRNSDMIVCFWDGKSNGTRHTINEAIKAKKMVLWYNEDGWCTPLFYEV